MPCSHVILFKDYAYYDDETEYLAKYFEKQDSLQNLSTLFRHNDQSEIPQCPNLLLHEQNKIIQKRNLERQKVLLKKSNDREILQCDRNKPFPEAVGPGTNFHDRRAEGEGEAKFEGSGRDKQEKNDNGANNFAQGSFQRELEQYEKNHGKISYETELYDIFDQPNSLDSATNDSQERNKQQNLRNEKNIGVGLSRKARRENSECNNLVLFENNWIEPSERMPRSSTSSIALTGNESFAQFKDQFVNEAELNPSPLHPEDAVDDNESNHSDLLLIKQITSNDISKVSNTNFHENFEKEPFCDDNLTPIATSPTKKQCFPANQGYIQTDHSEPTETEEVTQDKKKISIAAPAIKDEKIEDYYTDKGSKWSSEVRKSTDLKIKRTSDSKISSQGPNVPSKVNKISTQYFTKKRRNTSREAIPGKGAVDNTVKPASNKLSTKSKTKKKHIPRNSQNSVQFVKGLVKRYEKQYVNLCGEAREAEFSIHFPKSVVLSKITRNDDALDESKKCSFLIQNYAERSISRSSGTKKLKRISSQQVLNPKKQSQKPPAVKPVKQKESFGKFEGEIIDYGAQNSDATTAHASMRKSKSIRFVSNEGISGTTSLANLRNQYISNTGSFASVKSLQNYQEIDNFYHVPIMGINRSSNTESFVSRQEDSRNTVKVHSLKDSSHKKAESRKTRSTALSSIGSNTIVSNMSSFPVSPHKQLESKLALNKSSETKTDNVGHKIRAKIAKYAVTSHRFSQDSKQNDDDSNSRCQSESNDFHLNPNQESPYLQKKVDKSNLPKDPKASAKPTLVAQKKIPLPKKPTVQSLPKSQSQLNFYVYGGSLLSAYNQGALPTKSSHTEEVFQKILSANLSVKYLREAMNKGK